MNDSRLGQRVGHYVIEELIGEGSMGIVYRATDSALDRPVALKFLRPEFARDKGRLTRFLREAQAAASLNHTNICTIYELFRHANESVIAMEFVDGVSVFDRVQEGPLPIVEAIDIAQQAATGMAEAHRKLIVHRDISTVNLIYSHDGIVKITDFGIVKWLSRTQLTSPQTRLGTPSYMSPEQVRGFDIDNRSDLWSIGVVLYELLTATRPFDEEHELSTTYSIVNEPLKPVKSLRPEVPARLDRIVTKSLAKSPDRRYQFAEDFIVDLRRVTRDLEK